MSELRAGELVHLLDRKGHRFRLLLTPGATLGLHSGNVGHDDLIGLPEGSLVTTHMGRELVVLRPTFSERVAGRRRQAQPIYGKDLGAILIHADLGPGMRVLEAGTGTGALTAAACRAVGPEGVVVSYELRPEFLEWAAASIEELLGGRPGNLSLRLGDVYQGVEERVMDRVLLDLPEPWRAVPMAREALRPGGIVFSLSPNVSQVQRFCEALREAGGFGLINTTELLERGWTVRDRSLRPAHRMVAHSAFLTFARRLAGDARFEAEEEGF